jgi:transposase
MFTLAGTARIWLATGVTDMRRGFNGLHALIAHQLGRPPLNGDLYIFANRRRDLLKVFFFDAGGIWICAKRLERGTYRWPQPGEALVTLRAAELQLLLSGIDLRQTRARSWWHPGAAPLPEAFAPTPAATVH